MRGKRLVKSLVMAGLCVILFQAMYVAVVLHRENSTARSQAIVIFRGNDTRIRTGYGLAAKAISRIVVVSPATSTGGTGYDAKYNLPAGVTRLAEPQARTTLENAIYTARVIREHGLKTVTLVTSDYHMPRSLALLRLFLLGNGVAVHTYKVRAEDGGGPAPAYRSTMVKLLYNEMLEFWGSLVEYAARPFLGNEPGKKVNSFWGVSFLRSLLLLDVQAAW